MQRQTNRRPSPSMVVALLALFVALGGTSIAASTLISGSKIKKNSLPGDRVRKATLAGDRMRNGTITAKQLNLGKLGTLPSARDAVNATNAQNATNATNAQNAQNAANAANAQTAAAVATLHLKKPVRVTPSGEGATPALARESASKVELISNGSVSVYGKCFRDTTANVVHGNLFAASALPGSIFDSKSDSRDGTVGINFLEPNTPEELRQIHEDFAAANGGGASNADYSDFSILASDGSWMRGFSTVAVKNGTLPTTQGAYGAGSACIFAVWAVG